MESLQIGRLDFRKGQLIKIIDKVFLYELGSGLSPSRSAPLHQSWGCCDQPAPGVIVETCCNSLIFCMVQSFAIFGGVYAFASCIAQRLRQKQDGGPLVLDEAIACLTAVASN